MLDYLCPPAGIPHDGLIRWHTLANEALRLSLANDDDVAVLMAASNDLDALKKALERNDVPAAKAASERLGRRIEDAGIDKHRLARFWKGFANMLKALDAWQKGGPK